MQRDTKDYFLLILYISSAGPTKPSPKNKKAFPPPTTCSYQWWWWWCCFFLEFAICLLTLQLPCPWRPNQAFEQLLKSFIIIIRKNLMLLLVLFRVLVKERIFIWSETFLLIIYRLIISKTLLCSVCLYNWSLLCLCHYLRIWCNLALSTAGVRMYVCVCVFFP